MEARPAARQQRFAALALGLMALLAVPAYVLIGIVTMPIGLGLFMLINDTPWVLNLYPFIFGGTLTGRTPSYSFNAPLGILVTVLQWGLAAWLFGRQARPDWTRRVTLRNAALVLVAAAVAGAILLHLLGLQAVWGHGIPL
jgi:hypothetical protein